jgi:NlpC/P60 family protein
MTETEQRKKIVDVARSWLHTPFHDNQGVKHCGVDCLYFLVRVYEEACVVGPIKVPHYSPQIYLNNLGDDTYLKAVLGYTREITEAEIQPGDLVLFKLAKSWAHGGIIERWPDSIIHPFRPHGVMCSAAWEGFLKNRERRVFSLFHPDGTVVAPGQQPEGTNDSCHSKQ